MRTPLSDDRDRAEQRLSDDQADWLDCCMDAATRYAPAHYWEWEGVIEYLLKLTTAAPTPANRVALARRAHATLRARYPALYELPHD